MHETSAAATRKARSTVVFAALKEDAVEIGELQFAVDEHADEQGVDGGDDCGFGRA